jgi:hypothetical protein
VDGSDDGGRGVEGIEGGPLGTVILCRGKQRLEFFAQRLPACVLESAGDWIGKDRPGNGSEARETGERLLLFRRGGPLVLLDGPQAADGGDDVAGFGLFATGDVGVGRCRIMPGGGIVVRSYCRVFRLRRWTILVGGLFWRGAEKAGRVTGGRYLFMPGGGIAAGREGFARAVEQRSLLAP